MFVSLLIIATGGFRAVSTPLTGPVLASEKVMPNPINYFALHENDPEYWKDVSDRVIVAYKPYVSVEEKISGLEALGATLIRTSRTGANFAVMRLPASDVLTIKSYIHEVLKDPDVLYAEPERLYHACRYTPNDPQFANQWSHVALNTEYAWDWTLGNTNVIIAIVDEGVQYDHPDLAAHFFGYLGWDQVDNDNDPYPDATYEDHATHCAGVAAAVINNSTGIAGMSNSRLMSERVLSESGSGWPSDIADGIRDAADNGADIISMSLGGGYSLTIDAACTYAWNAGCLLVAASGNDGADGISYPARLSTVMAVGAIGQDDSYPSFSNRGPQLDVVAPGVDVLSTVYPNGYESAGWSGTSMATPHVSGLAGLIKALNPSLTNADMWDIIDSTATDIWYHGRDDTTGYGKINPSWAMKAADGVIPDFDTLPGPPDYFQSPYYYLNSDTIYEATLAVPETTCVLMEIWIAFYNYEASPMNKDVDYYVWNDNAGGDIPGTVLYTTTANISLPASTSQWMVLDVSAQNMTFPLGTRFWFGHQEPTSGAPTSLIDTIETANACYSYNGSDWRTYVHPYDPLQFVVVRKPTTVGMKEALGPDGKRMTLTLFGPAPSVARDGARVSFLIPYTQAARLDLYDAAGRVVWTTGERVYDPGVYSEDMDLAGLAAGHYFVVLSAQSGTLTKRLVKIK